MKNTSGLGEANERCGFIACEVHHIFQGTIRYEVLKRAKGLCELCGTPSRVKFLQVDHIIPRNKKGKSTIENYQALCYTCNSQKMDKDDADFRNWSSMYEYRYDKCIFCKIQESANLETTWPLLLKTDTQLLKTILLLHRLGMYRHFLG